MAVLPRQDLSKRDEREDEFDNWDGDNNNWYWSDEVRTIKYGTLLGILLVSFLVILGMWFHADQRMKKGLPPLRYHRWLVPRSRRAQWEPQLQQPEQQFSFYQQNPQQETDYSMHAVPPPAYNPNYAQPPIYTGGPPIGSAKVDPSEHPANNTNNPYYNGEGSRNAPAYPEPPHMGATPAYAPPPNYA
ncbi:hypothetical protein Q9L58_001287 [Maublancomyces gigas]|uniref:Uncharacterized protein n=1 Tax=Discina gigas TaxID=1032678 RepID=A0ABR3GUY4_9PEZI